MESYQKSQFKTIPNPPSPDAPVQLEAVLPNPKLKLLDQVREVMRLKHYSIRTERCYCDWIRRYIHVKLTGVTHLLGGGYLR